MAIGLMVQAFSLKIKSSTAKLILLKLADNANDNGYCYPSIDYIAKICEVDRRTVQRQIKKLEALGYVERTNRFKDNTQRSNEYHLHLYRPTESRGGNLSPNKTQEESIPSNSVQGGGGTGSPEGAAQDRTESLDLSNPSSKDQVTSSSKAEHTSNQFDELWKAWPNCKNKIRSKTAFKTKTRGMSPNAMTQTVNYYKIDIQKRLQAQQLGFNNMMLSTYLNNERYNDDVTNANNESVSELDAGKQASDAKSRELFGR